MNIAEQYNSLKQRVYDYRYNFGSNIKYYNFWKGEKPEEIWFSRFINSRNLEHRKKIYCLGSR